MSLLEEQKKEALKRIEILNKMYNLNNDMLDDYNKDLIFTSNFLDRELNDKDWDYISNLIGLFEKKNDSYVYYATLSNLLVEGKNCDILNLFFVGKYKDEWDRFRYPENDEVFVYTYNLNIKDYSEYGYIGVQNKDNRLARKY